MTQTKLQILGPYTPEHEGPFSFSGEECLVHGTLGTQAFISRPESDKGFIVNTFDLMNAREVPVALEFWVNEYEDGSIHTFEYIEDARNSALDGPSDFIRTIHVREVLMGEGE
ncbi:MAG: hypothetical protein LKI03_05995 [Acetobacter indonesiensis]|jgi:hypothetical protein|nr:hypothetical protein [Acetobacter indonesiensis]MCI1546136.1 hypothetical protein [Acetobacter indonesiensis]MCI1765582.1 hypothetical protein [Acetobacter indonesiensis]